MALLEISDLRKGFRAPDGSSVAILDVPSFSLGEGEQVALHGSSGSGKTTLLHVIAGILQADSGSVRLAGYEITRLAEAERDRVRGAHVGYIFQTFHLLQGCTALENVRLATMFGAGEDGDRARKLLERVGLGARLHYRPRQLSVGQQQRVAVARALANRPRLVLADEPTGNLDHAHAREALALIREVCGETGAALLLVSHDPGVLGQFDRVLELTEINRASAAR